MDCEKSALLAKLEKREDEIFWQLVNQVNSLKLEVSELNEKWQFASKNTHETDALRAAYNEQIDELEGKLKVL